MLRANTYAYIGQILDAKCTLVYNGKLQFSKDLAAMDVDKLVHIDKVELNSPVYSYGEIVDFENIVCASDSWLPRTVYTGEEDDWWEYTEYSPYTDIQDVDFL